MILTTTRTFTEGTERPSGIRKASQDARDLSACAYCQGLSMASCASSRPVFFFALVPNYCCEMAKNMPRGCGHGQHSRAPSQPFWPCLRSLGRNRPLDMPARTWMWSSSSYRAFRVLEYFTPRRLNPLRMALNPSSDISSCRAISPNCLGRIGWDCPAPYMTGGVSFGRPVRRFSWQGGRRLPPISSRHRLRRQKWTFS